MTGLLKREHKAVEPAEPAGTVESNDLFDRMFDDWMRMWPFRRPAMFARWMPDDMIKVDERREGREGGVYRAGDEGD